MRSVYAITLQLTVKTLLTKSIDLRLICFHRVRQFKIVLARRIIRVQYNIRFEKELNSVYLSCETFPYSPFKYEFKNRRVLNFGKIYISRKNL